MQGVRRPGLPPHLRMRYCMALHEAGRALTATLLRRQRLSQGLEPHLEKVERVSIVARGRCASPSLSLLSHEAVSAANRIQV